MAVDEDHPTNWRERSVKKSFEVKGKELCKEHGIAITLIVSFYIFCTRSYAG